MASLAKKDYLSELKKIDWDFTRQNGSAGFAGYHWYPARFVPQLAGILIGYLSEPGQTIIDPFCGSGTTLVEAYKFGRKAIGIDLNPVAVLMTKAKLMPYVERGFEVYARGLIEEAKMQLAEWSQPGPDSWEEKGNIPNIAENRKWYHGDTLRELGSIWGEIQRQPRAKYRDVALAAFSSILRMCSSNGDKHWGWICDNCKPKSLIYHDAFAGFAGKLDEYKIHAKRLQEEATELQDAYVSLSDIKVYQGDCAKKLSGLEEESADLVVTSPPYFSVTDYVRSQRLSFLWLNEDMQGYKRDEIGARYKRHRGNSLEEYLIGMETAMSAIARVLKRDRHCCMVIGESPAHEPYVEKLESVCQKVGLIMHESLERKISIQRSMKPSVLRERIVILRKS